MALLKVDTVDNAILYCKNHLEKYHLGKTEIICVEQALNRIVSTPIYSPEVLPNFTRSTVDGYAVRSKETQGASESLPTILKCVDRIAMGQEALISINTGECAYVPTGGMLPEGSDAVVMIEYTESFNENDVLIYKSITTNENVIQIGEDINRKQLIVEKGQRLNVQSIGVCAGVGIDTVEVYAKLNAAIISTGDEVFPINHPIKKGQVHDINGTLLTIQLNELNINIHSTLLIQDNFDELNKAINRLCKEVDVIFVSGGSSQGEKDYTVKIFESLGNDVVWSHGLAVKPGKPTILGSIGKCLLIGLPGHPVSAFAIFQRVFKTAFQQSLRQNIITRFARIDTNVISSQGKETIIFLNVYQDNNCTRARVVYTKSGLISTLLSANAYLIVPGNLEGYKKDELVNVVLI